MNVTITRDCRDRIRHALDLASHRMPARNLGALIDAGVVLLIEDLEQRRFGVRRPPRSPAASLEPTRPKGTPAEAVRTPAKPSGRPAKPDGEPAKANARGVKPNGKLGAPDGEPAKANARGVKPNGALVAPDRDPPKPNGRADKPGGDTAKPNGRAAKSGGDRAKPNGRAAKPNRRPATLNAKLVKPSGRPTTLNAKLVKPNGRHSMATRYIPTAVRRAVYLRDEGRCAFVDDEGRRCNATAFLQLHHLDGFTYVKAHDIDRIELRCHTHNQSEADDMFGRRFMDACRRPLR